MLKSSLKTRRKRARSSTTRRKRVHWGGASPPASNSIFSSFTDSVSSIFNSKTATSSIHPTSGKHIIVVYDADINNVPNVLPKPKIYSGDFQVEKYTEVSM